jgi:hypothetical protein
MMLAFSRAVTAHFQFGGLGCTAIAESIIPQCWDNKTETNHIRCFNTQLIRIQDVWETLAKKYPFVTAINLLGTTQVAGGDKKAAIGKPDLDEVRAWLCNIAIYCRSRSISLPTSLVPPTTGRSRTNASIPAQLAVTAPGRWSS